MKMLLEKLVGIEDRYKEINHQLLQVGDDYQLAGELGKEKADLEPFITAIQEYKTSLDQQEEARALIAGGDPDMAELAELEISSLNDKIEKLGNSVEIDAGPS